jgi:HK97 family phage major capsid protein
MSAFGGKADSDRATEFIHAARIDMVCPRGVSKAEFAKREGATPRVIEFLEAKAAVDIGTTGGTWGDSLALSNLANAFLASIAPASIWDAMFPSMLQAPLNTSIVSASASLSGGTIAEANVKPASKLTIAASDLDGNKVGSILVISAEVLKMGGPLATAFLRGELTRSITRATNNWILPIITSGVSSTASSGFTALGVRQDLRTLAANVTSGNDAKLFFITTRTIAKALAFLPDSAGAAAFPTMTPTGGTIGGVPVIACDEVTAGEIILVDAAQVAAGSLGTLVLDSSTQTSLQLDTAPDSPTTASTNIVSLYQSDNIALKAERWIGAKLLRTAGAAKITGAAFSGNSPV